MADRFAEEFKGGCFDAHRVLNELDLRGDGREDSLLEPVEFVKAPPRSTLHQAREDPAHGLYVNALVVVVVVVMLVVVFVDGIAWEWCWWLLEL